MRLLLPSSAATAILSSFAAQASYDVNIPAPATPVAHQIYDLHMLILYVCLAIFVVVFGAMFYSLFKFRKSAGAKAEQWHENTTVEVLWTVIPFLILVGMAYPATKTVLDMKDTTNPDMTIKVTAYQWKWSYDYLQDGVFFYSQLSTPRSQIEERTYGPQSRNPNYLLEVDNEMVVPVGKRIRLLVTSSDVIHGWYVPQLGINQYGIPGFIKDAWFKAEQPGIYRGQCSQICGKEHGYMPIVVRAVPQAEYAAWVDKSKKAGKVPLSAVQQADAGAAAAAAAAATPADDPGKKWDLAELRSKGEQVYAANCVACHQANGAGVAGAFPALNGSKVVNGPKEAQIALLLGGKPGTAMASFARLTDTELAAVSTYTRNAWDNKGVAIQPAEFKSARK
jgi:cytochrome c oxidase subunit 2